MFRGILLSLVVCGALAAPVAAYAQTAPSLQLKRWDFENNAFAASMDVVGCVEPGYKLVGGGAKATSAFATNNSVLTASYGSDRCWYAESQQDSSYSPTNLTVWAIGLYDPDDQWEVVIQSSDALTSGTSPTATARLPHGFALTGGGARVVPDANCAGTTGYLDSIYLLSSYPASSSTWQARAVGTSYCPGSVTSYAIGIRSRNGELPQTQMLVNRNRYGSGVNQSVAAGYVMTGGGSSADGGLLQGSHPLGNTWVAQVLAWGGELNVTAYAIGLSVYGPPAGFKTWDEANDKYWEHLTKEKTAAELELCNTGTAQSPIDISNATTPPSPAPSDPAFNSNYTATATGQAQVKDTGHSYQIWLDPNDYLAGSSRRAPGTCAGPTTGERSVTFDGTSYKLSQYHFHHPSEHLLDGVRHPLELHIVHVASDGKKLVLAVFLRPPAFTGETASSAFDGWGTLSLDNKLACLGGDAINPDKLLPPVGQRTYRRYAGSLTTPSPLTTPLAKCEEGVTWIVYTTPVVVSQDVFNKIKDRNAGLSTARPLQPLRRILSP